MKNIFCFVTFIILSIFNCGYATTHNAQHSNHQSAKKHLQKNTHAKKNNNQGSEQSVININTANIKQLATVKGIGVKRAAAIIQYRKQHGTFKNINDLTAIRGISRTQVNKIKNSITVATKNAHM